MERRGNSGISKGLQTTSGAGGDSHSRISHQGSLPAQERVLSGLRKRWSGDMNQPWDGKGLQSKCYSESGDGEGLVEGSARGNPWSPKAWGLTLD